MFIFELISSTLSRYNMNFTTTGFWLGQGLRTLLLILLTAQFCGARRDLSVFVHPDEQQSFEVDPSLILQSPSLPLDNPLLVRVRHCKCFKPEDVHAYTCARAHVLARGLTSPCPNRCRIASKLADITLSTDAKSLVKKCL